MKFTAYERTLQGTGASRRLRHAAKVPGIVYGAGTPAMIELDHNALFFALKKEAFHSSILEMDLAGKVEKVLLRDFQMHAFKPIVQHIDFQRVDETTKLRKKVPLHFSGEENSPAVKTDKCLVSHVATDIEVECLASKLPEFIAIELSGLVKNQSLKASELTLPEGIKWVRHGKIDPVIVAVTMPKEEVEEAAAAATVVAAAAPVKKKKDERQNKK
jgi:large subunit ribosomal protein L25